MGRHVLTMSRSEKQIKQREKLTKNDSKQTFLNFILGRNHVIEKPHCMSPFVNLLVVFEVLLVEVVSC